MEHEAITGEKRRRDIMPMPEHNIRITDRFTNEQATPPFLPKKNNLKKTHPRIRWGKKNNAICTCDEMGSPAM